jgi:hypothetical protein
MEDVGNGAWVLQVVSEEDGDKVKY